MKFVVEAIGNKTGGGVEVAVSLISSLARHKGHTVVVLVPNLPQYDPVPQSAHRVIRFPAEMSLVRRHFVLNRDVPRICMEENADALLCLGNFAPMGAPCPTVVFLQNAWYAFDEPVAWRRLTLRERLVVLYGRRFFAGLPDSVHVIVQTPVMRQRLVDLRGGSNSGITMIPSVSSLPQPARNPEASRHLQGTFTFLCLSRYAAHKNFEVLVGAVKVLRKLTYRPFRCLLTTALEHHPEARKLLKRIEREGLQYLILNIGPVPRERVAETYEQADAHLLPTLLETVSLTYDEAMHFGLPILTSDRDFARERCQDAAVYFDPLDAESVARAMASVMQDADLRARLVENGKRIVAKSPTWDEIAAQFVDVLERVATGRPIAEMQPRSDTIPVEAGESLS